MGNQRQAEIEKQTLYAWAAGFFDGEGCVSICKTRQQRLKGTYYGLKIITTQLDPRPLERFKTIFEVSYPIQLVKGSKGKQKDYHRLTFSGPNAKDALIKMLPHLTVKSDLARLGIEFQNLVDNTSIKVRRAGFSVEDVEKREALYTQVKSLQQKTRFRAAAETNPENLSSRGCDSPIFHYDNVEELVRNN